MNLSPNEIGACIFWCGTQFGPNMTPAATQGSGGRIVQHVPKPGSPERKRLEDWLDIAVAIALAESGGDTNAKNPKSSASGLWQIMVSAHEQEIKFAQTYWATQRANGKTPTIFDPLVNTQVAASVYSKAGNSWAPWETYTSGAYRKNLGHGKDVYAFLISPDNLKKLRKNFLANLKDDTALVDNIGAFVPGAALLQAADKYGISGFIGTILQFLRDAGLTVGAFLLGLILVILGIWFIVSQTKAGKTIKSAAKHVVI